MTRSGAFTKTGEPPRERPETREDTPDEKDETNAEEDGYSKDEDERLAMAVALRRPRTPARIPLLIPNTLVHAGDNLGLGPE